MGMRWGVVAIGLLCLNGCATFDENGEYSCKGIEDGVRCLDSVAAYQLTNDPDWKGRVDKEIRGGSSDSETPALKQVVTGRAHRATVLPQPVKQPVPILKPAEVMRVWIAPWVDTKQDLHWPGYVFTEITPRRWTYGESEITDTLTGAPVIVEDPATPTEAGKKEQPMDKIITAPIQTP